MKVALVIGTRPEAIKMAPIARALKQHLRTEPCLISTGQHRELLTDTLESLNLVPDTALNLMQERQTLDGLSAQIHEQLPPVFEHHRPDVVLVQGDTTTALKAAMVAFHAQIPVGHVEAGLRTGDLASPFPEEGNRVLIDAIAQWCFAPTESAADNLRTQGVPSDRVLVTGNTAVDSLLWMIQHPPTSPNLNLPSDYLLLTLHRRESFGSPLVSILEGLRDFLEQEAQAEVVWPMHPNPRVAEAFAAFSQANWTRRVHRVAPPSYGEFCQILAGCRFALSDSGGVQEEGPSLGKRVLIAREQTERPEAVDSGHNTLVGRERRAVTQALANAWTESPYGGALPAPNPYGDGQAAERIVNFLVDPPSTQPQRAS